MTLIIWVKARILIILMDCLSLSYTRVNAVWNSLLVGRSPGFNYVWAFNAASVANKSPVQIEKGLIIQVILGMENGRMKPEITFKLVDRSFNTKTNRQQVDSRTHQV